MFDHFHATILVLSGGLANQTIHIEGGLAPMITPEKHKELRAMDENKRNSWMASQVCCWLPDGMSLQDQFEIILFHLAG